MSQEDSGLGELEIEKCKPELVVALVARLGTDLEKVISEIKAQAIKYDYESSGIKVTDLLEYVNHQSELINYPIEDRYDTYIKACNQLRSDTKCKFVLSLLVANYIQSTRKQVNNGSHRGVVYIVNQLKKPEEVEALREIYGDALLVVSCHAPYTGRISGLTTKINLGHEAVDHNNDTSQKAIKLIEKDESELDEFGQNVRAAFPLADSIVDTRTDATISKGVSKLFKLIFGDPTLSPSFEEYGNNLATQAALRSTDLSRQVGAAIFDKKRTVISVGSNEVPKPGGGTYWFEDDDDGRDASAGFDINTIKKRDLVIDVVDRLQRASILIDDYKDKNHENLRTELIDKESGPLHNAKILDILEYGRALHAEMNAITDAARINISTDGAQIFVTTFPCHNCAKHIVGSGISRVSYLEPYPKSEVESLYPDSIVIDPDSTKKHEKTVFEQFCGITSLRFSLFSKRKLKDHRGMMRDWKPENAECLLRNTPAHFHKDEIYHLAKLKDLNILRTDDESVT